MTAPTRILTNGKIWCGLAEGFAEALAIAGDKVLAAGTAEEIGAMAGPDTEITDLGGKLATPGLNDAHLHLHFYGQNMRQLDLRPHAGVTTVEKIIAMVKEAADNTPPGTWILGRGYDHDKIEGFRHPHKKEIDAVAPDHPVMLTRACGHTCVVNTKALELAGIGHNAPDPAGGKIGRDPGELNGLLWENARFPVQQAQPEPSAEDWADAIDAASTHLLSLGITSVMDPGIGLANGLPELRAYQLAHKDGRLKVRVAGTLMGDLDKNILDTAYAEGLVTGVGDDMFRIGPVKIFTDGSAGAGTAWMTQPYWNDETNYGVPCLTPEQCEDLVMKAHKMGYQMAPHAIGDAAIGIMLDAYEKAYAEMPDPDRRHRIEHCGWHTPEQLERMKAMKIIPAGQPSFLYFFGDGYFMCLGPDRPHHCYPFKTWLEEGLHPSASTDCPVTDPDPFPCLYALIARKSDTGKVLGDGQQVSVAQALHMYTYEPAYGVHDEDRKGRLIPGQLADVAVFDTDFFEMDKPEQILDAQCVLTIRGGETVFERAA
ncbi:MAG: amidohydrolase [Rhodobacteraceae bacterium]|nr:amidohydrolase [Paracoccaceae bacterium]MAY46958.1 amidohydrolase [Paracoccaceae bacterium]